MPSIKLQEKAKISLPLSPPYMAASVLRLSFTCLAASCFFSLCLCFHSKHSRLPAVARNWSPAGATWYGSPDGAGNDGNDLDACMETRSLWEQAPFSHMIAAGSPSLFKSGKGCGACYQVRCTANAACSQKPVTVVITDECPGGPCLSEAVHFDLSGAAFGAMALPGLVGRLRSAGTLPIQYSRVACEYPGRTVSFHVEEGSNSNYFAVVIEFEGGDGDLAAVELKESRRRWRAMRQSWGAAWKIDSGSELHAPFSIRLTSQYSGRTLLARNVIPARWKPGATYRSLVNFN